LGIGGSHHGGVMVPFPHLLVFGDILIVMPDTVVVEDVQWCTGGADIRSWACPGGGAAARKRAKHAHCARGGFGEAHDLVHPVCRVF
jgi:hypothetical protein